MTKTTKDILTIVSVMVFTILVIVFAPLATIWSLNTLFPVLAIPFGFYQWLAVAVLNLTLFAKVQFKKD
jgi:hypothetical protein